MGSLSTDAKALVKEMMAVETKKNGTGARAAFLGTKRCNTVDDAELREMKEWIKSLSFDDLQRAMEFTFLCNGENAGNCEGSISQEYYLLKQMISLQPPPPTPVHPRAVPYKPATKRGLSDGRNEEERRWKKRFDTPRLFQLIERHGASYDSFFDSELSCSVGYQTKSGVKLRARKRSGQQKRHQQQFDVLARKFSSVWGDVLTVGTTNEQRDADAKVLKWTQVKSNKSEDLPFRCSFCCPSDAFSNSCRKDGILRALFVASRGRFLTMGSCESEAQGTHNPTFCAQWLDPTVEWFSLPTYLSSRFEVALWRSFHHKMRGVGSLTENCKMPEEQLIQGVSDEIVEKAIFEAVLKAVMLDILGEDMSIVCVRDSMLHNLLFYTFRQGRTLSVLNVITAAELCSIPLVEVGSARDNFRLVVLHHLRTSLSHHTEMQLLKKDDEQVESIGGKKTLKLSGKKKKKKKKKRRKTQAHLSSRDDDIVPLADEDKPAAGANEEVNGRSSHLYLNLSGVRPSEERNRNTITVLFIVEEVINSVFEKVGLGSCAAVKTPPPAAAKREQSNAGETRKLPPKIPPRKTAVKKFGQAKENQSCEMPYVPSLLQKRDCSNPTPAAVKQPNPNSDEPSLSTLSLNSFQHQQQTHHQHVFPFISPTDGFSQTICESKGSSAFFDVASPLGMSLNFGSAFDEWGGMKRYQSREKSLFAEFFNKETIEKDVEELLMTASTAASIASSSGDEVQYDIQQVEDENEKIDGGDEESQANTCTESDDDKSLVTTNVSGPDHVLQPGSTSLPKRSSLGSEGCPPKEHLIRENMVVPQPLPLSSPADVEDFQTPSPSEPPTPPPQLSPIQVSLADIGKLRKRKTSEELRKEFVEAISNKFSSSAEVAGSLRSLPSSPKLDQSKRSWSREDLRSPYFNDDQVLKQRPRVISRHTDASLSYRNAVTKSLGKASSACSHDARSGESIESSKVAGKQKLGTDSGKPGSALTGTTKPPREQYIDGSFHMSACAQSETALEGHEDNVHWNATQRVSHHDETDNATTTRDGATTISSGHSPPEAEEVTLLREERNAYRDLCLTLGAEVAKLKNQIASEMGNNTYPTVPYISTPLQPAYFFGTSSYDPEYMPSFLNGIYGGSNRTLAAMSDAGIHQDLAISEDGTEIAQGALNAVDNPGVPWPGHANSVGQARQTSAGGTKTASDACSTEYGHGSVVFSGFRSLHRDNLGSVPLPGLQSRLSIDIENFLRSTTAQLKKQESRRKAATNRLSLLVTAMWPRAQVKHYGSHVSNLCLPSSDIDFVICLPAVHKKDIAVAPGVLEGRNAINETNQKMLARKLKGESWIDPRSIKLIERTVVPVIKVSTKDMRARVLQLDISFDGPEHHGLDAVRMVTDVMEEFPMVRPLVLVLKQFLLDRGLLTAYTGGLSSYCLFLMVTRYLQEQPTTWNDCGTLLMGFLDFYGNSFDPRSTGISVRRRQYFSRPYYAQQAAVHSRHTLERQMWNVAHQQQPLPNSASHIGGDSEYPDLSRRHSFSEAARGAAANVNGASSSPGGKHGMKPPRFQPKRTSSHHSLNQQVTQHNQQHQTPPLMQAGMPYTFDPLFVEDPMNAGNNVGRNSFRIFQVKRAFSDAHRALVASLEWDINSTGGLNDGSDYPLLKCLFNSEDTFFCEAEIPDNRP